jgi:tetratricopeptide (TPR) repeat protein
MSSENKKNIVKMATIYAQEGKWEKAIGEYKKLVTLDPTDYNVHNMLGDAYLKKGDDALSYQEYIIAAEAYIKQGLADKANIVYKKIGKLDSEKLPEKDKRKNS